MSELLTYLNTAKLHDEPLPVSLLTALHAARVTVVWAQVCKGKDRRDASFLQGLWGYLTLAWGGGAIVSLLLSQPPAWLLSPMPWFVYVSTYVLLHSTGISGLLTGIPPIIFTLIDAATRTSGIAALPSLTKASGIDNWWANILLSGIAVSGGGWVAQAMGMTETQWCLNAPTVLQGGIWLTLDLWSGMLVAAVIGVMRKSHPQYQAASALVDRLPGSLVKDAAGQITAETARGAGALVMAGLLAARVVLS